MQKTVRINLIARNSAAKHLKKLQDKKTKAEWKRWHDVTNQAATTRNLYVKEERQHRRQDWISGPLAPNRNVGNEKGVFGTVTIDAISHGDVPEKVRAGPKKPGYAATDPKEDAEKGFRGDTIVGNIVKDDRVVVVAGPEHIRGMIGIVSDVDHVKEEVRLRDINLADIRIPNYAQPPDNPNNQSPARYQTQTMPIPMSHIRLVIEIKDDDGTRRDVIVRHVHGGPPYFQRRHGSSLPAHTRYLTGSPGGKPLELQWPPENIDDTAIHAEGDTTRMEMQEVTWVPGLAGSPLGYKANVPTEIPIESDPYSRAKELLTIDTQGVDGLRNIVRVGLTGFVDNRKLQARQERIAKGIMDEFRTKHKELNVRHDDAEWVKRKIIEDARSIWYQERKVATPAVQAAEAEVQRRTREREERIAREREREVELANLVARLQTNPSLSGKFQPDKKLRKELARMAVGMERQATKVAQTIAAE